MPGTQTIPWVKFFTLLLATMPDAALIRLPKCCLELRWYVVSLIDAKFRLLTSSTLF